MDTDGPDCELKARTIASDLYGTSEFFHFIINTVLEELMGIKHTGGHRQKINRKEGIFSQVANYIRTMEAQGHGTLHFHTIVWLEGAPMAERMKELLLTESFQEKVAEFIKVNIKGDVGGLQTGNITDLTQSKDVSYLRSLDPRQTNYVVEKSAVKQRLVRALQIHRCTKEACLVLKKTGYCCK